jgi:hypothetical protein
MRLHLSIFRAFALLNCRVISQIASISRPLADHYKRFEQLKGVFTTYFRCSVQKAGAIRNLFIFVLSTLFVFLCGGFHRHVSLNIQRKQVWKAKQDLLEVWCEVCRVSSLKIWNECDVRAASCVQIS